MTEPQVVRRPVRANTPLVRQTLDRLADVGVTWAPRFLAIESGGTGDRVGPGGGAGDEGMDHEVLSWLPGRTVERWRSRPDLLDRLAEVVGRFHELTSRPGSSIGLVHDDLQPRNVVVDGDRVGLIDWEQLRPGRPVEDVSQLCWSFVGPEPGEGVGPVAERWRRIIHRSFPIDRAEVVPVSLTKLDRCIDDIVRSAARGSERHQLLQDRGDHHDLERIRDWLRANGNELAAAIN